MSRSPDSSVAAEILLWGPGAEILSVYIFDLWQTGHPQALSALGLLLVAALFLLAMIFRRLSQHYGLQHE